MARTRSTAKKAPPQALEDALSKLPVMLGARIRHARRVARLTMTQLAVKAGCSESLISKIENGHATPSLAMLHRIAGALDSNVAALSSGDVPANGPVLRRGQRPVITSGGIALERIVLPSRGGLLQVNIHILQPGSASDGLIVHVGEEVGYVLEGRLELLLGDDRHMVEAGDAFSFASQVPHGYRNAGETVARVLWVNTPPTF